VRNDDGTWPETCRKARNWRASLAFFMARKTADTIIAMVFLDALKENHP
jgi:hypothetical protein